MARWLKEERGYSLVEVMVAILLLSIAIIPMVGMFDTGLKAATQGGAFDEARALANQQMEKVIGARYAEATSTYGPPTPSCTVPFPPRFTCEMNTYYVLPESLQRPTPALTSGNVMEVVVTIKWDDGNKSYTINGLKSKGLQAP